MSQKLREFINTLLRDIYSVLDNFLTELEFYLDPKTPQLEAFGKLGGGIREREGERERRGQIVHDQIVRKNGRRKLQKKKNNNNNK